MAISVFDLFSIGIGPSSSHTVGPMRAANRFVESLDADGLLQQVHRIKAELYGSLGATGKGHGSDKAVILGFEGELPETVDTTTVDERLAHIRELRQINLLGKHSIKFMEKNALIMHKRQTLPFHPNGMTFSAFDAHSEELCRSTFYSVGGGFIVDETASGSDRIKQDDTVQPYPFLSAVNLLIHCANPNLRISDVMMENEKVWRSETEIREGLLNIWRVMQTCVDNGCVNEGILPGGLKIKRRAADLYRKLNTDPEITHQDPLTSLDKVIKTMRETGADMKTKYKETARGGLAVNIIEC